jgi:hypothetical protein
MSSPFLISFTPIQTDGFVCASINDMVSIDLQQQIDVSEIMYRVGTDDNINIPVSIKNITNNTLLNVKAIFSTQWFSMDVANPFSIAPGETRTINFQLNKPNVDTLVNDTDASIQFEIENVANGSLITKNPTVSLLTNRLLQQTIPLTM